MAAQIRTVSWKANLLLRAVSLPVIPETKHPHKPERVKNLAVTMYTELT